VIADTALQNGVEKLASNEPGIGIGIPSRPVGEEVSWPVSQPRRLDPENASKRTLGIDLPAREHPHQRQRRRGGGHEDGPEHGPEDAWT